MLRFVVVASVIGFAVSVPIDNEIEPEGVDVTYLGSDIFGAPKESVGKKLEEWNENSEVNPEELGEYAEGDILFPKSVERNGLIATAARWKEGVVPYEISPAFPPKDAQLIRKAMEIYHKYTCIRFRERTSSDSDYLSIVNSATGCWSSVGRTKGKQVVNLQNPACTTKVGTPMHELMHALGFVHEQTRWERDDYVTIVWRNIKQGHENNFQKQSKDTIDGFGVPYDYTSVMHYSPKAFSVNGEATIIPKDTSKSKKIGQRDGFSRGDITKINAMYGCSNKLPGDAPDTLPEAHETNNGGGLLGLLIDQLIT